MKAKSIGQVTLELKLAKPDYDVWRTVEMFVVPDDFIPGNADILLSREYCLLPGLLLE